MVLVRSYKRKSRCTYTTHKSGQCKKNPRPIRRSVSRKRSRRSVSRKRSRRRVSRQRSRRRVSRKRSRLGVSRKRSRRRVSRKRSRRRVSRKRSRPIVKFYMPNKPPPTYTARVKKLNDVLTKKRRVYRYT